MQKLERDDTDGNVNYVDMHIMLESIYESQFGRSVVKIAGHINLDNVLTRQGKRNCNGLVPRIF